MEDNMSAYVGCHVEVCDLSLTLLTSIASAAALSMRDAVALIALGMLACNTENDKNQTMRFRWMFNERSELLTGDRIELASLAKYMIAALASANSSPAS
jgi:hypothetical protein